MRPIPAYIASTVVMVNGVRAFNAGDDVPADAVENLGLVVGRDVMPAGRDIVARPTSGKAKRADWEAYWLGQGLTQDEVDGMTRDEMAQREPEIEVSDEPPPPFVVAEPAHPLPDVVAEQATEQTAANAKLEQVERPGSDGKKADWVAYAVARGMDRAVAEDSTIAQLSEFDYDTAFGTQEP
jgi:hypothetical protein